MKLIECKLSDIADIIAGQSPESKYYNKNNEGYPFLQGKTDFGNKYPSFSTWCTVAKRITQNKDILLSVRAPVGAVNIAKEEICIGRGIAALRVKEQISYEYVYYFLKFNQHYFKSFETGTTFKAITVQNIRKIPITIPKEYNEQIKIANLLSKIENLLQKREKSIELLDSLIKSTFLDMFGDPVVDSKNWGKVSLDSFGKVVTGNTPPRGEKSFYDTNFIEWIKTDNLFDDRVYATKAKEYLSQQGLSVGRSVENGSILVTCIAGSVKSIGTASLVDRKVAFNQQINAIQPFDDVDSFFLYWMFKISKHYIQDKAGKGMKKIINKSAFQNILFPKPEYDLQKKFGDIALKIENIKKIYQNSLDELKQLFGSTSQKAFKGELELDYPAGLVEEIKKPDLKLDLGASKDNEEKILDEIEKAQEEKTLHFEKAHKTFTKETVTKLEEGELDLDSINLEEKNKNQEIKLDISITSKKKSKKEKKYTDKELFNIDKKGFYSFIKSLCKTEKSFQEISSYFLSKDILFAYDNENPSHKKNVKFTYKDTIFELLEKGELIQIFDKEKNQIVLKSAK